MEHRPKRCTAKKGLKTINLHSGLIKENLLNRATLQSLGEVTISSKAQPYIIKAGAGCGEGPGGVGWPHPLGTLVNYTL